MKTNYVKMLGSAILFAMVAVFPSCTKDDAGAGLNLTGTVNLRIVNGAEGSGAQDFFLDNTKVNSSAVAYTETTAYTTTNAGSRQGQFKASGSSTTTASANLVFEKDKYYTVYLGGSASSSSVVATSDDMTPPPSGKARVRFVHLSSAVTSGIDLAITGGAKIVSGLAYQTASAYNDVDANTAFTLYSAGSATAALTIPAFVQAGKIYTIFISGSSTATVSYHVTAQN